MIAARHYMVPIDRQVNVASKMVEDNMYFCINRGRQYGKTTTLSFLKQNLEAKGYVVFSISFEGLPDSAYESLETLLYASVRLMELPLEMNHGKNISEEVKSILIDVVNKSDSTIDVISYRKMVASICASHRIVLFIDEVDQAGNYPQFIQFLGLLREMYLSRDEIPSFQSIILAGVYDIRNLKLKLRPDEQHQYNSPWNIAAPFDTDMSLRTDGIAKMLAEYKVDHSLEFDERNVAQIISDYTSGYPYLVSRLCQIIDENSFIWDKNGVIDAVNLLLKESNTLFDDITKKLTQFPNLSNILQAILYGGQRISYNFYDKDINLASMFYIVYDNHGITSITCRIFETWLYNYYSSFEKTSSIYKSGEVEKNKFIHDGRLDMRHILERFVVHFNDIYRPEKDDRFVEENGRKIFLTYLRPIINGVGNYYCEAQTRDFTRTDVVVDYLGQQYVIELKIWRGDSYNQRGENQLLDYLDYFHLNEGFLLSFCFNKNKQTGIRDVLIGERRIIEAIV